MIEKIHQILNDNIPAYFVEIEGTKWYKLNDIIKNFFELSESKQYFMRMLPGDACIELPLKDSRGRISQTLVVNSKGVAIIAFSQKVGAAMDFAEWFADEVCAQVKVTGTYVPDAETLRAEEKCALALAAIFNSPHNVRMAAIRKLSYNRERLANVFSNRLMEDIDFVDEETLCKRLGCVDKGHMAKKLFGAGLLDKDGAPTAEGNKLSDVRGGRRWWAPETKHVVETYM